MSCISDGRKSILGAAMLNTERIGNLTNFHGKLANYRVLFIWSDIGWRQHSREFGSQLWRLRSQTLQVSNSPSRLHWSDYEKSCYSISLHPSTFLPTRHLFFCACHHRWLFADSLWSRSRGRLCWETFTLLGEKDANL